MWLGAGMTSAPGSDAARRRPPRRPARGGGRVHRLYTVVVFIALASLDNTAIGLVPPLYAPIAQQFGVGEAAITAVTAVSYLASAVAAVAWAYVGDRSDRKPLLMAGTLIWAAGTLTTAWATNYAMFFAAQFIAAIGLGAVASVGFSVVSDLISPRRRGLVMSFWGLSQGVGTLAGTLAGGLLGSADWRRPFVALSIVGASATVAFIFTYDIRRGQSEPQLAGVFAAGEDYDYRITHADLPRIARRRTNVWLTLQGFTAQMVFGSLVFLPRLFQAKAESLGFDQPTAIDIGAVYATLFPTRRRTVHRGRPHRRPTPTPHPTRPGHGRVDRRAHGDSVLCGAGLRADSRPCSQWSELG